MYILIDSFISEHPHLRGSFHMTEQLRELIQIENMDYFNACEYILNNYGYSI